jgi:hypothetical protein
MSKTYLRKKIGNQTFCWQPADEKLGYKGNIGTWWLEENGKLIRPADSNEYQKLSKIEKVDSQSKEDKKADSQSKEDGEDDEDNGPMGYDKASKIRKKSFGDLLAEKIVGGGGIGESFKSSVSDKFKAKIKGIKETFDPMNMAKSLGGRAGAAIYGKLRGRSEEDMEYFAGGKKKRKDGGGSAGTPTADKLDSLETGNDFLSTLVSIQELLSKREEENKNQRESENNFAEENKSEKDRRHNELIAAITGNKVKESSKQKETATKEDDSGGLDINPNFRINPARALAKNAAVAAEKTGAKTATQVSKDVIKKSATKTLGKSIGKGALKSIPILGAAIGAGFAISRLIDGDVVGAGIEAASGLGSALTSIPLTITNAARDVYKSVYGDFPDPTDPQDQKNLSEIYDICKEVAAELLKDVAVDKVKPGEMQYDEMGNVTGYATPEPTPEPKKSTSATPASSAPSSPAPTAGSSPTPASSAPSSPAPTAKSSPTPASTASPTASPNVGQTLNSAVSSNLDLKASPPSSDPSTVINNSKTITSKETGKKEAIPPVRNSEPTFQRMIFNSTKVV